MSKLKTFYYIANVWDRDELHIEDAHEFKSNRDVEAVKDGYDELEVEWLVEDMASDYIHNHDGWEIAESWHGASRQFAVWDSDKNFIGKFEVMLEYEPRFNVWRQE